MDCHWKFSRLSTTVASLSLLIWPAIVFGQSITARLELEITATRDHGRVLSVRTVIKNNTERNIFLTNFIHSLEIEKLDDKSQYDDFSKTWFILTLHDSTRAEIELQSGIVAASHNDMNDKSFLRELSRFNKGSKDSISLLKWSNAQVEMIETIESQKQLEFQTNINALPNGKYRIRFSYVSSKNGVTILPAERFKIFKIPDALLEYMRWNENIVSTYVYLTVK